MSKEIIIDVDSPAMIRPAIQSAVDEVVRELGHMSYNVVLGDMIPSIEIAHQMYFTMQAGPDKRPWRPLAASTIRKKGSSIILIDTGKLISSLTSRNATGAVRRVENNELTFGTSVPYSWFHQRMTEWAYAYAALKRRLGLGPKYRLKGPQTGKSLMAKILTLMTIGTVSSLMAKSRKSRSRSRPKTTGSGKSKRTRRKAPMSVTGQKYGRPHVGLTPETTEELSNMVADNIVKQLRRQ